MNSEDFEKIAITDPYVSVLLWESAENSGLGRSTGQTFSAGLESTVIIASYALFRYIKMRLDAHERSLELDTAQEQIELIQNLMEDGWSRKKAEKLVPALLSSIKSRQEAPEFKALIDKVSQK